MKYSPDEIRKAAQALSERYRQGISPFLRSEVDRYAYLVTRYPATQAALKRVFQQIRSFPIQSMLDIGAGPGTSWGAASEIWHDLKQATLLERDKVFVEIGKASTPRDVVSWISEEASTLNGMGEHDVVLFSYSWGEIEDLGVLEQSWKLARKFLVIVEPGTPQGFARVLKAREFCVQKGGKVFAPCPHSEACPWKRGPEWCHFGVRLERSFEHRFAKEGALGYEDEKFSYVILSKQEAALPLRRLLKDPARRKGHTIVTLCTSHGIERAVFTKKNKEEYKAVNKLSWGDKI